MKNNFFQSQTVEERIEDQKRFLLRRKKTYEKNKALIKKWDSMPKWKFWDKQPSFEEKRAIILSNWGMFKAEKSELQ